MGVNILKDKLISFVIIEVWLTIQLNLNQSCQRSIIKCVIIESKKQLLVKFVASHGLIDGENNLADLFTKSLNRTKRKKLLGCIL